MSETLIANRYRLNQLLANVNHSEFYEGYDTHAKTPVIIRLLHLDQPTESLRRKLGGFLENEFRVIKKLDHPNILRTLDFGLEGELYYQVNEHIAFETLQQHLQKHRKFDLQTALRFTLELADIISHLHHIGIIHCDVKLENVLVSGNVLKLMEFSIANHARDGELVTGTPPYMSPESAMGEPPAVTRDVWALGVCLFELLTGRTPYILEAGHDGPEYMIELLTQIVREPVPSITQFVPDLPPRLIALINWMLEKDPNRRISSMRHIAAELEAILTSLAQREKKLSVGDLMGERYQLQTAIAEGGFGQVFRGADLKTGQTVAIKQLKPDLAENPQQLARFKREAEILHQLNHPGIVKVLDTVESNGHNYIVMEYVEGGDLRSRLKTGPLSIQAVVKIALELADALARAHHLDLIHRDIKPENILIASDGTPRLTDFGVVHIENAKRLTETGQLVGTLHYLAPEILKGEAISRSADIWSFGILLYEMLTGEIPFKRETVSLLILAILNDPIPELELNCPECPERLTKLVEGMLKRDVEIRLSSMRQIAAQLEEIRASF